MKWSPQRIRELRLKFGWSAAEFGRRLGLTLQEVVVLESGLSEPRGSLTSRLGHLETLVEQCAMRTSGSAMADLLIEEYRLAQITADELQSRGLS